MFCTDKWIFRIEKCKEETIENKPTSLSVIFPALSVSREIALVNGYSRHARVRLFDATLNMS